MQQQDRPNLRARVRQRSAALLCAALACAGFLCLGSWQLARRDWKHALIARVDARVHAPAVAAPAPPAWPAITAATDEYRRVRLEGVYHYEAQQRVQAVTVLGPGYWILTPLQREDHSIVYVNRGFVAAGQASVPPPEAGGPGGHERVEGLLRLNEPGGAFLRDNDAAASRWYSRDVLAMGRQAGLAPVAPYFVDADARAGGPAGSGVGSGVGADGTGLPVGGLTVIQFSDSHLVYALTWFGLAILSAGAAALVLRDPKRTEPDA